MAGASDKARFYLEQAVPELREWERREIFTKDEINSIASKRSDFEHIINARGSSAADYTRYVEYEMNLDSLRRKRVKRRGAKTTAHTGQRRIFSLLDRATRKFPGDIGLWMQYIDYARKQRANKKLAKVLTDVLRMHPIKPQLWIYAARYATDVQADIGAARSCMQRGLRFCKTSQVMYLEYARLEMAYIAKISARRRILGFDSVKMQRNEASASQDDSNADMISLPTIVAGDIDGAGEKNDTVDDSIVDKLAATPVMTGAIPLAIFEAAMKQFHSSESLGVDFFNMLADFDQVPCIQKVLQAVLDHLYASPTPGAGAISCRCRFPLIGVSLQESGFPAALRTTLAEIKSVTVQGGSQKLDVAAQILTWLAPLARESDLGPELKRVLIATETQLRKLSGGG